MCLGMLHMNVLFKNHFFCIISTSIDVHFASGAHLFNKFIFAFFTDEVSIVALENPAVFWVALIANLSTKKRFSLYQIYFSFFTGHSEFFLFICCINCSIFRSCWRIWCSVVPGIAFKNSFLSLVLYQSWTE